MDIGAMRWFFTVVFEEIEPEEGELREDTALVRNAAAQDVVEGGDAVRGDEEELPVDRGRRCRGPCRGR